MKYDCTFVRKTQNNVHYAEFIIAKHRLFLNLKGQFTNKQTKAGIIIFLISTNPTILADYINCWF